MATFVDQLGNWNPQVLREFRGRLRPRSVLAAVALSVIFQALLGLFISQLPISPQEQWVRVCQTLTWCIPYVLLIIGSYYLVSDFMQEEKRGTLNFIRLSPRPAHEFLLGKLIGVPILPYIVVATALPLQWLSAFLGGVSWVLLGSYYLVLLMAMILVFCLAMLAGLTAGNQSSLAGQQSPTAIAFAALALFFFAPAFMLWNQYTTWYALPSHDLFFGETDVNSLQWLYLPISNNPWLANGFTVLNLAIGIGLSWQVLRRLFHHPRATLLSKRLSYVCVAYLNVLVWGFYQSHYFDGLDRLFMLIVLYGFNASLFLVLFFALTPQRQILLDWSRWRAQGQTGAMSLIWDDQSPAVGAIAINFLIAAALLVPWALFTFSQELSTIGILLAALSIGINFLTYATLIQLIFSARIRNPHIWGAGTLGVLIVVPLILMGIFKVSPNASPGFMTLWTFLGYPFWRYSEAGILMSMVVGLVLQIPLLSVLLWRLNRNLHQLVPTQPLVID